MAVIDIRQGDCRVLVDLLSDDSVDAVVTDPPYALLSIQKRFAKSPRSETTELSAAGPYYRTGRGFMGQQWDTGEVAFDPAFWLDVLRALKPGGHVLAFGGTRSYHRLACAIEDAGFEIRDQIGWAYGSGFPKSHNLDGEWDGWGTALKPAWEPICVARKPLDGTVAANVLRWGTGALNIDGCRVEFASDADEAESKGRNAHGQFGSGPMTNQVFGKFTSDREDYNPPGRWPANLIHDGSDEVLAAFPETGPSSGRPRNNGAFESVAKGAETPRISHGHEDDGGSAARFFYCAKARKKDRNDGCDALPDVEGGMRSETSGQHITRRDGGAPGPTKNNHPTVKPTPLMQYLCRLVTPPGGLVLDPFMGSGSTGRGAVLEGFRFIGFEQSAEYVEIARARIAAAAAQMRESILS